MKVYTVVIQGSPVKTLCLGSIIMDHILSELCYKGTVLPGTKKLQASQDYKNL